MPEYLAPGVYIEEVDAGPKPIEGVSTSTAGMVGMTVRGPNEGLPKLVTSFADFKRKFGGYLTDSSLSGHTYLPYAVQGFFANGGKRLYIKRVVDSAAVTASTALAPAAEQPITGLTTRLLQNVASGATIIRLSTVRGVAAAGSVTLTQTKDGATTSHTSTVASYSHSKGTVTLDTATTQSFDARYTAVAVIADLGSGPSITIEAADPGAWGNDLSVELYHTSAASAAVSSVVDVNTVQLASSNGFYTGAIVEFDLGASKVNAKITAISGNSISITPALTAVTDLDSDGTNPSTMARTCEFSIVASYDNTSESFTNLTLDNNTDNYYQTVINETATLIQVPSSVVPDTTTTHPFIQPSAPDGLHLTLAGGTNGSTPGATDYMGEDNGPGARTGIAALADIDEISILAVPGITTQVVQEEMISHCETLKDRFAILDPDYSSNDALEDIQTQRNLYDSKYAALYFPNLKIFDPVTEEDMVMPPSGHMLGLYAQTDIERGVHKAPANIVVGSITGLDLTINKAEQDILNPRNINVIRDFRSSGRSYRVWGARCVTSDSSWKYIPVRRLFIFVEESLDEGLQWVVFEPNDQVLWARVRQSISNFLTRVWRDGALMGATVEEAFFVRCDRTTMTQDDIDNGRLIVQVGIAPVKPAEFVIIRISQYTVEANSS